MDKISNLTAPGALVRRSSALRALSTHQARFVDEESGAVTVDWTVITAAAVGLALATAALFTDINGMLATNMNNELSSGELSDGGSHLVDEHWEPLIETAQLTEAERAQLLAEMDTLQEDLMNNDVLVIMQAGLAAIDNDTITQEELIALVAVASVAHQRNLVDDATLDHYFGFDGSDPHYLTTTSAAEIMDANA